jgi:hypothetical protein
MHKKFQLKYLWSCVLAWWCQKHHLTSHTYTHIILPEHFTSYFFLLTIQVHTRHFSCFAVTNRDCPNFVECCVRIRWQYLKINCWYFQTGALLSVGKYFKKHEVCKEDGGWHVGALLWNEVHLTVGEKGTKNSFQIEVLCFILLSWQVWCFETQLKKKDFCVCVYLKMWHYSYSCVVVMSPKHYIL